MSGFPQVLHTVLDTIDVRGQAEFYRQLLGLQYRPGDEPAGEGTHDVDWLVLTEAVCADALLMKVLCGGFLSNDCSSPFPVL